MKVNESELSPRARAVWDALDEKTRKAIQKDNPFRNERNKAIRELVARGVKYVVLEEITGISDSRLQDIVTKGCGLDFMKQNKLLDDFKKSFDMFHESLSTILKGSDNHFHRIRHKKDHR